MKIYIASSWKNESVVNFLAQLLREDKFEVDAFTDSSKGRFVFHFSEIGDPAEFNAKTFLAHPKTKKAFKEDKKWLDWCDCCLLLLPSGKSAHLEAGYAKGRNKRLIIFSPQGFIKGEFDVMYGFADLITCKYSDIIEYLE